MKLKAMVMIISIVFFLSLLSSCNNGTDTGDYSTSGLYLSIIGFNTDIYQKSFEQLTGSNKYEFENYISSLNLEDATILFHAVNTALDSLQDNDFPSDLSRVAIVTFTDGLDYGSYVLNGSYNSTDEYQSGVVSRILGETVNNIAIESFSVGVPGDDIETQSDIDEFNSVLTSLANPSSNSYSVSNMTAVNDAFREIAESLTSVSTSQSLDLTIPAHDPGTIMRFTFDSVSDATASTEYIEGTFTLSNGQFSLTNITYNNMSSTSGTSVSGTQDGVEITFTFENVEKTGNNAIDTSLVQLWNYSTNWRQNSEFDPNEDIDTTVEQSSAAIVLVLDSSSSLDSDFVNLQNAAISFVDTISENFNSGYGLDIEIYTGSYASEISWAIENYSGTVVASGSGYSQNNTYVNETANISSGSYTLYLYDSFGDGWNGGHISLSADGYSIVNNLSMSSSYYSYSFSF